MLEVIQSREFRKWFGQLRDRRAKIRILTRITRMEGGNPGNVKSFHGIHEMRIDYGPGYRLYYVKRGPLVIVLVCGGDKRTQNSDIQRALKLAKDWGN